MHILLMFFLAMLLALVAYHFMNRIPRLPRSGRDWGSAGTSDPRVAIAAMMYAVATEDGPLTGDKERRILALLGSTPSGSDPIWRGPASRAASVWRGGCAAISTRACTSCLRRSRTSAARRRSRT